jgi:anthranilate phosphoribosyltransferase
MDINSAMVVSSLDGMDEISVAAPTKAVYYNGVKLEDLTIRPESFGIRGSKEDLVGGDAKDNAKITRGILSAEIKDAKRDAVLLNAAAALFVDGKVNSIEDGIKLAAEAIDSGRAIKHLEKIIEVSNKLSEK